MEIKHGTYKDKGSWHYAKRDGERFVVFTCPDCGSNGDLTGKEANHTVNESGKVEPSVVCDCGFHEFITLVDFPTPLPVEKDAPTNE